MRGPEMSPSSFLCQTSAPTMAHLFHWHPLLRTGLRVPQKIHRESSPSYGAIPYYTWVLLSELPSICCSNGCLEMWSKEVAARLPAGIGRGAGRKHANTTFARIKGSIMGMGWKLEEAVTTSGGKWEQEDDDKVVQFMSEIGGGNHPQLPRAGTSEAELPDGPFHIRSKTSPFPWSCAGRGRAGACDPSSGRRMLGCERHRSVCPSDRWVLTRQDSALRLKALPSPLFLNSYKFHGSLLGRVALSGRACSYGKGGCSWGAGRARARQAALPAIPACSPALPPRDHHGRPCRSPPDVCSGKKLSTKLAKTILRAAGNIQNGGSALAHWGMPMSPHGDPTAWLGSAEAPSWLGKQLSSCSTQLGGKLACARVLPRAPCLKERAAHVLWWCTPRLSSIASQTSLAQRLILVFTITLINGKPSWSNFCCIRASVLKEECRSFPVLRWPCCSQISGQLGRPHFIINIQREKPI